MMAQPSLSAMASPSPGSSVPTPASDMISECVSVLSHCLSHFDGGPVSEARTSPVCRLLEGAALRLTDTDPTLAQPSAASLLEPAADLLRLHLARHGAGKVAARPGREWPVSWDVSRERVRLVPRPERRAHTAYTTEPVLEWHQVLAVCPATTTKSESEPKLGFKATANSDGATNAAAVTAAAATTAAAVAETGKATNAAPSTGAAAPSTAATVTIATPGTTTGGPGTATPEANRSRGLRLLRKKYQIGSPTQTPETGHSSESGPSDVGDTTTPNKAGRSESTANTSTQSLGNPLTPTRTPESRISARKVSFQSHSSAGPATASPPASDLLTRSRSSSRPCLSVRRGRSASVAIGSGRRGSPVRPSTRAPRAAPQPPPSLSRAVSVAAGGDLWCTTSADWEHEMKLISDRAERLVTGADAKRPETIVYGQLVIHHNCVLPDLPRFLRCLSLRRRSSDPDPVPVWLCDAARTLLVPRATLLSACCDALQLYRRPPLLLLLTGKRLAFSVPARLVSGCLSLLTACLPWLTGPASVRRLTETQLPVLAAELGSSEALELLSRLTRQPTTAPLLRSVEVAAPIADLAEDQLDLAEPDQTELRLLIRLLRAAVGPGLADPVRRLLAGSQLIHELLRLEKTDRLEMDVRRLLSRLQEDESPATTPTMEGSPKPAATSTPRLTPTSSGSLCSRWVRPACLPGSPRTSPTQTTETARTTGGATTRPSPTASGTNTATGRRDTVLAQRRALLPTPTLPPASTDPAPPVAPGRLVRLNSEELRAHSDGSADERTVPQTTAAPARLRGTDTEFLRRGQRSRLRNGPLRQLERVKTVQDMGQQRLALLLCGLLNAGEGGAIYYGVSADGRVEGLQLDGGRRDRLRLGVDKVTNNLLEPPVPPDCVRLQFVPVLDRDQSTGGFRLSRHSLFVVVIHCQSPPREVFLVRAQQTAFLRRMGSDGEPQTVPLSLPQLRQLVASQEMALVSGRQAAPQSTAACLRRVLDAAPAVCGDCGGTKAMGGGGGTVTVPADCRKEVAANGWDQSGRWTD